METLLKRWHIGAGHTQIMLGAPQPQFWSRAIYGQPSTYTITCIQFTAAHINTLGSDHFQLAVQFMAVLLNYSQVPMHTDAPTKQRSWTSDAPTHPALKLTAHHMRSQVQPPKSQCSYPPTTSTSAALFKKPTLNSQGLWAGIDILFGR
eukprot:1158786-Pelagomonas_calceolata.AAC.13